MKEFMQIVLISAILTLLITTIFKVDFLRAEIIADIIIVAALIGLLALVYLLPIFIKKKKGIIYSFPNN